MLYKRNFPPMTQRGWSQGGIRKEINRIHLEVCEATDAYDPDDPIPAVLELLDVMCNAQTAIDMICERYNIDMDRLLKAVVKKNNERGYVDKGVDVALWLEAQDKEG